MSSSQIDAAGLRQLLAELLRTDSDLEAFCLDYFPAVKRRFSNGMERTQKETILLENAPSREAIVTALKDSYPRHAIWARAEQLLSPSRAAAAERPSRWLILFPVVAIVLALLAAAIFLMRRSGDSKPNGATEPVSQCGGLVIDDLHVLKQNGPFESQHLSLDVRLRNQQVPEGPIDITRATLIVHDKVEERAPYLPSETYDLLIRGKENEIPLHQLLQKKDEVDRILIRLGFSSELAGYQYTVSLKFLYNRTCTLETKPFELSREAARWTEQATPWPKK